MSSPRPENRSGLWNLPAEVLAEVTPYLTGLELARLYLCGCKRLIYGMCEQAAVREFRLRYYFRGVRRWPSLFTSFNSLETLELQFGHSTVVYADCIAACATWPKTVRTLSLCFRGAESSFMHSEIKNIFPHLTSLTLSGWPAMDDKALLHLPASLTYLNLPNNRRITPIGLAKFLPTSVLHVLLNENRNFSSENWVPVPRLKTLVVPYGRGFDHHSLKTMEGMTELSCTLMFSDTTTLANCIQNLPRSLLRWTFRAFRSAPIIPIDADFPPYMKYFECCAANTKLFYTSLPASLTTLIIQENIERTASLFGLPPGLIHLSIEYFTHPIGIDDFKAFPKTLRHIKLGRCDQVKLPLLLTDEAVPDLPPLLHTLSLPTCTQLTGACFAKLPRSLIFLDLNLISQVNDSDIADLPRYLAHLFLSESTKLTDACVPHLPRGLTELVMSKNQNFTFACVPHLPLSLEKLDLGPTGVASKYLSDRGTRRI